MKKVYYVPNNISKIKQMFRMALKLAYVIEIAKVIKNRASIDTSTTIYESINLINHGCTITCKITDTYGVLMYSCFLGKEKERYVTIKTNIESMNSIIKKFDLKIKQ